MTDQKKHDIQRKLLSTTEKISVQSAKEIYVDFLNLSTKAISLRITKLMRLCSRTRTR